MNTVWKPKVSVIIPVYNGSNYMCEAIYSALAQTYPNVEVIVVNDGSKDDGQTDRIATSYGDKIIYIKKENGGVSSALNCGIAHMTGEYFSWLSHDDVYTPDKIKHQIDALSAANDKNSVVLCAHAFINERSEKLSKSAPERFTDGVHAWNDVILEILRNGAFSGCALLIPKEALDKCGKFHEGLRFSQDALMWMNIFFKRYSLIYNSDEDVYSRIHGKQVTQTARDLFKKDSFEIANLVIPDLVSISSKNDNYLYLYAKRNAKFGNGDAVDACVDAAKPMKLFNIGHKLMLKLGLLYGEVRPLLRKIYYKLFVKLD